MFTCPACNKTITNGGICNRCGRLFCEDETSCTRCNETLDPIVTHIEKVKDYEINWILHKKVELGFINYTSLPRDLVDVWGSLASDNGIRVILFKTKNEAVEFVKSIYSDNLELLDAWNYNERSRYSVIRLPYDINKKYILLNMSKINIKYLDFLLNMFFEMNKSGNLLEINYDKETVSHFGEILFKYNKKMDIPFVSIMGGNKTAVEFLLKYINMNYEEFKSIRKNSYDLAGLSDYLLYKIEMYFGLIYDIEIKTFLDLLSFFNTIIYIHSIKSLSLEFGDVYNEINNLIIILYNKLFNDDILPDDLKNIVRFVINKETIKINSYSDYSSYILETYSESIDIIENYYGLPEETIEIFRVSHEYLAAIEGGYFYSHPELGDVYDYLDLLTKIFMNEKIDVILRLSTGESLHNILMTLSLFYDYRAYIKLISITEYYANFIINNIDKINEDMDYIGVHDSARVLIKSLSMSEYNDDDKTYDHLYKVIDGIINEYNLIPYKIILEWKSYMKDGDESHLKEIYKLHNGINYEDYDYLESHIKLLGVISLLIIDDDNDKNYELASTYNEKSLYNSVGLDALGLASYIMYNDLVNIIYGLKKIIKNNKFTDINLLKKHMTSFIEMAGEKEKLKHFIFKTEILINLINEDDQGLITSINKLENLNDSIYIKEYCNNIKNWSEDYKSVEGRSFILTKYINDLKTIDPWNLIFKQFVIKKMNLDLNNNVILYDAILLVEGKTDLYVFKEIINNIYSGKNILYKDMEGYTNLTLFYKEMQIIESFNVPICCIFDGDTKKSRKMRKIKEGLLNDYSNEGIKIYVLNRNTIEDYLINPKLIKTTFPEIKENESEIDLLLKSKRNKKSLLHHLFKRNSLNYNSETARILASNIDESNLDPELKSILDDILT